MTLRTFVRGVGLAAGTVVGIGAAGAADLPMARKAPPPVAPVAYAPQTIDWTGFYVGGHLGAGFENASWSDPFLAGTTTSFKKSGFLGGGQIGANKQFGMLVVGAEGDFSFMGLKGSNRDMLGNTFNTKVDWTSTITGRVGAAIDRFLVYGKGGLAITRDNSSLTTAMGNVASANMTRTGWTAGGGVEYAFDRNWSARVEYDYLGFGSKTMNFTTPAIGTVPSSIKLNVQEVKAGFNYKFGQ